MNYPAFPDISLSQIFPRISSEDPFLNNSRFYTCASGRAALYHGMRILGHTSGKTVLMPAFHCGVEVEAVLRAGWKVRFYRIDRNLCVDMPRIIHRRRANYSTMLRQLGGGRVIRPLFETLPAEVCPLCFPVIVSDSDAMVNAFSRAGVGSFVFGRFSHSLLDETDAPDTPWLASSIIGLPVSQQLDEADMAEICRRVRTVLDAAT